MNYNHKSTMKCQPKTNVFRISATNAPKLSGKIPVVNNQQNTTQSSEPQMRANLKPALDSQVASTFNSAYAAIGSFSIEGSAVNEEVVLTPPGAAPFVLPTDLSGQVILTVTDLSPVTILDYIVYLRSIDGGALSPNNGSYDPSGYIVLASGRQYLTGLSPPETILYTNPQFQNLMGNQSAVLCVCMSQNGLTPITFDWTATLGTPAAIVLDLQSPITINTDVPLNVTGNVGLSGVLPGVVIPVIIEGSTVPVVPTDVNIIGFARQNNPLWVAEDDPLAPPIAANSYSRTRAANWNRIMHSQNGNMSGGPPPRRVFTEAELSAPGAIPTVAAPGGRFQPGGMTVEVNADRKSVTYFIDGQPQPPFDPPKQEQLELPDIEEVPRQRKGSRPRQRRKPVRDSEDLANDQPNSRIFTRQEPVNWDVVTDEDPNGVATYICGKLENQLEVTAYISYTLGIDDEHIHRNYWSVLEGVPEESEGEMPEEWNKQANNASSGSGEKRKNMPAPTMFETTKEKKIKLDNVLRRMSLQLQKKNKMAKWYVARTPSKAFASLMCNRVWGNAWENSQFSAERLFMYCRLNRPEMTPAQEALKYLRYVPGVESICETNWFQNRIEIAADLNNTGFDEAKAAGWARAMHSLVGNVFTPTMASVEEQPTSGAMYETSAPGECLDPNAIGVSLSGISSSAQPQTYADGSFVNMRADYITVLNATVAGATMFCPDTMLYPREVRAGAGAAPVNSLFELRPLICGVVPVKGLGLVSSEAAGILEEATRKMGNVIGKQDATLINGFSQFDLVRLMKQTAWNGLCMDGPLLKLTLLHSFLSWGIYNEAQPWGGEGGAYDNWTKQADNVPTLAINDSPVFGEDCGGLLAPEYPFTGGTGDLAIHVCFDTIPPVAESTVFYFPVHLITEKNYGVAIALFVIMMTDYPSVLPTVSLNTTDNAGGNPAVQTYIPFSQTTYVPGSRTMHIIMPKRTPRGVPTNQALANDNVNYFPYSGPDAAGILPANTPLEVSWLNGAGPQITYYNITDFVASWMSTITGGAVQRFLGALSQMMPINDSLKYVRDLAAVLSVRYPVLRTINAANLIVLPFNNGNTTGHTIIPAGFSPNTPLGVWPQAQVGSPHFFLRYFDITAWNKVATGLATVEAGVGVSYTGKDRVAKYFSDPFTNYHLKLIARTYALTYQVHLQNKGLSGFVLDNMFQDGGNMASRELARSVYAVSLYGPDQPINDEGLLVNLYQSMFVAKPCMSEGMSVFGCWGPPRGTFSLLFDVAMINAQSYRLPAWLPDFWLHVMTKKTPRWLASWPVAASDQSVIGMPGQDKLRAQIVTAGGVVFSGIRQPDEIRALVGQDDTVSLGDDDRWNDRILDSLVVGVQPYYYNGTLPLLCGQGMEFTARAYLGDFTIVGGNWVRPPEPLLWNSGTMPMMDPFGQVIFLCGTLANTAQVFEILLGNAKGVMFTWALKGTMAHQQVRFGSDGGKKSKWFALAQKNGGVKGDLPQLKIKAAPAALNGLAPQVGDQNS